MKIITFMHQKGGVGKSSGALDLYRALAQGYNVGLYDTDPQGSITVLDPPDVKIIKGELNELRALKYDIVIIDTPPYIQANTAQLITLSDLIIVPAKVGIFEVGSLVASLEHIQKQKAEHKSRILFTMVQHNSSLKSQLNDNYNELGVEPLENYLTYRVGYVRGLVDEGMVNSIDQQGVKEIHNLSYEILKILYHE